MCDALLPLVAALQQGCMLSMFQDTLSHKIMNQTPNLNAPFSFPHVSMI